MNARFWRIGLYGLIALLMAMGALFVGIWLPPGTFLTDRGTKGMRFCLWARLRSVVEDSGVLDDTSRQMYGAARFQTFVATKNNVVEDFWMRGKKHSVRYTLNPNLDSWTSRSNIDWIVQAEVSCATNLMFKVYSNLDVLPMHLDCQGIAMGGKYERFIKGIGGLLAFEEACNRVFMRNGLQGDPVGAISLPSEFSANGAQGLRLESSNDNQLFMIIYLNKDVQSGFIVSQSVSSDVNMPRHFNGMYVIRLDERIWWFDKSQEASRSDEAYSILHGK